MATNIENATAIVSGQLGKAATVAQVNRVGVALATQDGNLPEYQSANQDGKAAMICAHYKRYTLNAVRSVDVQKVTSQAAAAAIAAVEVEFPA